MAFISFLLLGLVKGYSSSLLKFILGIYPEITIDTRLLLLFVCISGDVPVLSSSLASEFYYSVFYDLGYYVAAFYVFYLSFTPF